MDNIPHEDYLKIKDNPDNLFSAINAIDDKEKRKQFYSRLQKLILNIRI